MNIKAAFFIEFNIVGKHLLQSAISCDQFSGTFLYSFGMKLNAQMG